MDLDDLFDFHQECSSSSTSATDLGGENSIISSSQSTPSLMQILSPSEDTIRNYLSLDENNNNSESSNNSSNAANLDSGSGIYHKTNNRFEPMQLESDRSNFTGLTSTSSDTFDHNNLNLLNLSLIDHGNSLESYECHEYQWLQSIESHPQSTYDKFMSLKSNNFLLAKLGYKFTITLNSDNDKVQEIWNPNVAQKILSAFYSPLGLKGNYLSIQVSLDQFESYLLSELVHAFQDNETVESPDLPFEKKIAFSTAGFVSTCGKIKNFKKLCNTDKIVLLSNTIYDFISWKAVFYYDHTLDGWTYPKSGLIAERRNCFICNRSFHDAAVLAIERLPDKWRYDINVDVLISLISILDPDQPGLKYVEVVRQKQYLYIYLLQRYLESVCESPCEVSDNYYRLMVGVERCKELGKIICREVDGWDIGNARLLQKWIGNKINI